MTPFPPQKLKKTGKVHKMMLTGGDILPIIKEEHQIRLPAAGVTA